MSQKNRQLYQSFTGDIQTYQLAKFNALWPKIYKNVPYYENLVRSGDLPFEINSYADFIQIPPLNRTLLQNDPEAHLDRTKKIARYATTGGSTGAPFCFPYAKNENEFTKMNMWLDREFYNIQVSDRKSDFWGHSHLFGLGIAKYKNQTLRHFPAYNLLPERLKQAGQALIKMRPDYIVRYSRSLYLLAKENEDLAQELHLLPIKAIIATSEPFIQLDDLEKIEEIFGCPVAMEYGAVETGVLAYTNPTDKKYHAFWDTYLWEAIPTNSTDARILITSLYPRVMPLIRYEIGDTVRNYECAGNSPIKFDYVLGRDNDLVNLQDGSSIHPEVFTHCIEHQPEVLGIQVIQGKDLSISINIMCKKPLVADTEKKIHHNLSTIALNYKIAK